jgi:hypothetical protein
MEVAQLITLDDGEVLSGAPSDGVDQTAAARWLDTYVQIRPGRTVRSALKHEIVRCFEPKSPFQRGESLTSHDDRNDEMLAAHRQPDGLPCGEVFNNSDGAIGLEVRKWTVQPHVARRHARGRVQRLGRSTQRYRAIDTLELEV